MIDEMDPQNEPLTKKIFFDAIDILESRIDAKLDARFGVFESRMDAKMDARFTAFELRMDAKFDAKLDALESRMDEKIDALALSTQQEFSMVQQEFVAVRAEMAEGFVAVWKKMGEIEDKMVTKQDFFQFETRIMSAIGTIADEIKNLNSRVLILEKMVRP